MAQLAAASVQSLTELQKGTADERQSPVVASLAITHQPATTAPGPAGTFFAQAGASVWALDSANGKVLWRRPVGTAPGSEPVRLPAESAGVLLVDARHRELLCVDERAGSLRWRHSFDSPIAGPPLPAGDKVFVTTRSGRVTSLSAASGDAVAAAALPAEARGPAAMDAAGQRLYQLADRDFLYVLATGNLKCERADYLGHRADCIDTPPAVISGRIVVPENRGIDTALLHVVSLDEAGVPNGEVQHVELPGHVVTPPVVLQDRLLVLTDRGTVITLELPAQSDKPLKKIAESSLETAGTWLRFGVAVGNRFCIADDGLRLFDFTPASGALKAKWSSQGGVFQSPPQVIGDVLLGVRQTAAGEGWIASAVKASDGQPLWETPLAMPLIDLSVTDAQSAQIVSSSGASAVVSVAEMSGHKTHELPPLLVDGKRTTIAASIPLAGDRRVLVPAGQARELLLIDSGQTPRSISIPDPLAGVPVAAAGGLVLPCTSGAIYWLNAEGVLAAGPIQMSMTPGTRLTRCCCATVGENGEQFVVSDGLGGLYHLAIEKSPQPQLKLLATARLSGPPISPIAASGENVYIVDRGKLLSLALPDLKPAATQQLDAQAVVFGPKRVGDMLLLATDRQKLVSIGSDGSIRWQVPLDGNLAGSPIESAGTLIAATRDGLLLRLAADSGKELARVDLGEPLLGSPVVAGSDVLVATADGVLLKVALPNKQEAAP
jgi:outer membrane protein assembly factor BamB